MLSDILNGILSIIDFLWLLIHSALDFFSSIPKFAGYISDMIGSVPTFLIGLLGIALSVLIANKVLSLI